mmetsp:Transcript_42221/g.133015  ORF Transcript_42221/g.133015 Transcript_42221/m.133015 type:complete len:215 (+) Transcript_42221:151-795(+)
MELIQSFVSLREQRLSDHDEKLLPEGDGQPSTSDDRERSSHFDEVVHKLPEGESPVRLMLKQLILAEGINRNQSHIVLHGHLHETLPVLQVQHIFLFVRPFQDFLDPSDDEAEAISSCQLLLNALSVARDHSVQRHQRRQDWNVEHGVVDPSEEFLVSELREPDVEKTWRRVTTFNGGRFHHRKTRRTRRTACHVDANRRCSFCHLPSSTSSAA